MTPARNPPVQHVEDQRDRDQQRSHIRVPRIPRAEKFHRLEDRSNTAKTIGDGEEIGEMETADHREMSDRLSLAHNQTECRCAPLFGTTARSPRNPRCSATQSSLS